MMGIGTNKSASCIQFSCDDLLNVHVILYLNT
jgi:hypothetical protein